MVVGMENTAGRTPIILMNGKTVNSIEELSLKNMEITLHIDTLGIFFHKKVFGIKWNIKKVICNSCITEIDTDKLDIENQWIKDIDEFEELVEQDCIKRKEYLVKTQNLLKEIREIPEVNKTWNEKCEILSKMISNYKSL
ncbi:MAG: hypothetical protein EBU66_15550 [Bacteroidetes bacterium]|nr:hypothetical protein [Bacteroidota bacterium]